MHIKLKGVPRTYTTGQIAKFCKVAPRTVSKWIDSGQLKGFRIPVNIDNGKQSRRRSGDRRVSHADFVSFLKKNNMPLGDLDPLFGQQKILVVGSEYRFYEQFKTSFTDHQEVAFEFASDPFQAGVLAVQFKPTVVLIDFQLGRGEAIAVCRRVLDINTKIKVIGLTNEDDPNPEGATQFHSLETRYSNMQQLCELVLQEVA